MTDHIRCDRCSVRLDPADAITHRHGTFCTTDCSERARRADWQLADPTEYHAEDEPEPEFTPALIAV
jgi:hypothetical protein